GQGRGELGPGPTRLTEPEEQARRGQPDLDPRVDDGATGDREELVGRRDASRAVERGRPDGPRRRHQAALEDVEARATVPLAKGRRRGQGDRELLPLGEGSQVFGGPGGREERDPGQPHAERGRGEGAPGDL